MCIEKPKLWVMVGLPRSGKSTLVKKLVKRFKAVVINPDSVRLAIHGQALVPNAEDFVWATTKAMVRALYLSGHNFFIIDATNISKKRRDMWKYLGIEFEVSFIEVKEKLEVCLKRAGDNESLKSVIKRMADSYEEISDEGELLTITELPDGGVDVGICT